MENDILKVDIEGYTAELPILPLPSGIKIAFFNLHGNQELTEHCGKALAKRLADCDVLVTAESKGLQLTHVVARELGILTRESRAAEASALEEMDDEELRAALKNIDVIARSTPAVKLRVVKALKESGEVVAVTGDGINDAPAIRHADVGIAMGVTGSQITKEAADVILLNDSFATVVKAVAF